MNSIWYDIKMGMREARWVLFFVLFLLPILVIGLGLASLLSPGPGSVSLLSPTPIQIIFIVFACVLSLFLTAQTGALNWLLGRQDSAPLFPLEKLWKRDGSVKAAPRHVIPNSGDSE